MHEVNFCTCFQSEKAAELHALCCAAKPLSGWLARDAIQESREACGGHGYLLGMKCFFFVLEFYYYTSMNVGKHNGTLFTAIYIIILLLVVHIF